MRLKTFSGATMAEAMDQVRKTLGPDAIIVSTQQRKDKGVLITAAIEEALIEQAISEALAEVEAIPAPKSGDLIGAALAFHAVPPRLQQRLIKIAASVTARDPALALAGALDLTFKFQPLPTAPDGIILLVGPPGAGKTALAAKIAAAALLGGRRLNVISTDTVRKGGLAQIEGFVRLMKNEVTPAATPSALAEILGHCRPEEATIIDTRAANPYNDEEMIELKRFVATARAEPILVLPAGLDLAEAADQTAAFGTLRPRRLIVTRLDATRRMGAILAADAGALAITGTSATPFVADAPAPLNPLALARLLLKDPAAADAVEDIRKAAP
ncbi:MAG: AAA family ATPase [Alphaproteobacteria bacterium]|nr:AAA family ATPase [Alphaproteobacteria bacterium]